MDGQDGQQQGQAPQAPQGGGGMVDELRRRAASMGQDGQPPAPRPSVQGVQPGGTPPQAAPGGSAFGFNGVRPPVPVPQRPPMPVQAPPQSAQMVINRLAGGTQAAQPQAAMPQQALPVPPQAMPQQGAMSPEIAQSIINRVAGGQAPMGPPPNPLAAQAAPIPPQPSQRPPLPPPTAIAPPPSQLGQPMMRPQAPMLPQQAAPMMAGPQVGVLAQMPMQQQMSPADVLAQRSRLSEYIGG